jgi:hypothetical protein
LRLRFFVSRTFSHRSLEDKMCDVMNLLCLDNTYTAVGLRIASEGGIELIVDPIAMAAPESHFELS